LPHPLFEIVTTRTGAISIRNKVLNETMHNPVGPWAEANSLYISQSKLAERLQLDSHDELVLFDVGLGAAANALAVLHCARAKTRKRPLRMISFERELELLRFALKHASQFEHFHGYEKIIEQLLATGKWHEDGLIWELRHGDFVQDLLREKYQPHLIYYDPYSSKVNREMWSMERFRDLRSKCREANAGGTLLFTYSQATPIRVALLSAGFFVGQGLRTGPKEETTIASSVLADLEAPLGQTWFQRWQKSHVQVPFDCSLSEAPKLREWMTMHPQFQLN
jgi:queuine tRNA-ribosyltransferase